jgi:lipopolysaccharide export system protein LptA
MIPRLLLLALLLVPARAWAQPLDLSHGGPVTITSRDGIDWQQQTQVVIARGDARAVRDNVTVTADRLIAHYRRKADAAGATTTTTTTTTTAPAPKPAPKPASAGSAAIGPDDTNGSTEVYRLEADGNVHIFTATDLAEGDHATYDMDQSVLVLTGRHLKLTRPTEVITARDSLEYWAQEHRAVARGNAVVVTSDARRLAGDILVAYTSPPTSSPPASSSAIPAAAQTAPPAKQGAVTDDPLGASGRIEKVEAFGNVSVRTQTDTVTGDRGVYVPDTGIARLAGNVHITRGQNQLNGAEAEVDLKTGISRLLASSNGQVRGLVLPNDATNQQKPAGDVKQTAPANQPKDAPK